MTDAEPAEYAPESPTPPVREPPRRSTAPQSAYTLGQVGFGFAVLVVGLLVTLGIPLILA